MVIPMNCLKMTSKIRGRGNHGKQGMVMHNEVFKYHSNDFISNIKESVDVTLATDDNKKLESNKKIIYNSVSFQLKK